MARTTSRKPAKRDAAFDAARKRMGLGPQERRSPPKLITPQIPTLAREVPTGLEWIHEIKHDGWRAIVRIEGQHVAILTRSARNVTRMFSRLVPALRLIGHECILDGEIAAPDDRGVTRLDNFKEIVEKKPERLVFYAFDLLWLDGEDWRTRPLLERKSRLEKLIAAAEDVGKAMYVEHVDGQHGPALYEYAMQLGCEGILSKRAASLYRGQKRDWLEIKPPEVRKR
jgi:bifunctional non-homologous end joining protein LigD